jgi:BirA family biotin operon repressor/biotin-[acetyl-CoA-carboxylase] ligase
LTFTLLLRPTREPNELACFPLVVGLGVRAAVAERVSAPVRVKWPNDVLVDGKKVAGILVEAHTQGTRISALAVGVGVNVFSREFPEDLRTRATSLIACGDPAPSRESLLVGILAALEERMRSFEARGFEGLVEEFERHDALLGQSVCVDGLEGVARGVQPDGSLRVEDGSGRIHRIVSGSVDWMTSSLANAGAE